MSIENQLREALSARADEVGAPAVDPYARVSGAIAVNRRRRRSAALAGVAAVAVIALAIPSLAELGRETTTPAKKATLVVPGPNDPRWSSISTWPVRGSLATDTAFLSVVGTQFETSHILYAADLPTSRVVVSWGLDSDGTSTLTMLSGPRGASADTLTEASSASGGEQDAVLLREHSDNDSTLVILARPGVSTASISRSVQIGLDGSVTRDAFRTVRLTDGVYSELLQDSPPSLTRVKVGDGTAPGSRVTLMGLSSRSADPLAPSICLNCTGEDFRSKAEPAISAGVAATLGLSPRDVTTITRYYGPVDHALASRMGAANVGAPGETARLIVADSTLPQGQVLRSALLQVLTKDGSAASTMELATGVPIDAATAAARPFVLQAGDAQTGTTSYEVFATMADSVRLVSSAPSIYPSTARLATPNGTALATTPTGGSARSEYDVETYDGAGSVLGRWPVDLPADDTWSDGTTRP